MIKSALQRSVRFDPEQYDHLKKMAAARKCTPSDVLREIISQHLADVKVLSSSHIRQARLIEFAQAALDTIILEQHPEHRDRLVEETRHRMERYHGA